MCHKYSKIPVIGILFLMFLALILHVNLGNISYNEVIPLETLRIGLRGDTFFDYLSKQ